MARIGLISYGYLGSYVYDQIQTRPELGLEIAFAYNRTPDRLANLPSEHVLENLADFAVRDPDLVVGDLYCLIEEAKDQHIPKAAVDGAYKSALQDLGVQEEVTDWHLDMGGLCWSVHCLQWILEYGLKAIPISKDWVPDFLTDMCATTSRLDMS